MYKYNSNEEKQMELIVVNSRCIIQFYIVTCMLEIQHGSFACLLAKNKICNQMEIAYTLGGQDQ